METNTNITENIIVADADYLDVVAFNLIVNFERMLERRIPQADMARWAECVALDGGLRGTENAVRVVLVHDKKHDRMDNFKPSSFSEELDGHAFTGPLGEFTFNIVSTEEIVDKSSLICEVLTHFCEQKTVKRLMVVPADADIHRVGQLLSRFDSDSRRTTLFSMQTVPGGAFRHELLGYSVMSALGIYADEIDQKLSN